MPENSLRQRIITGLAQLLGIDITSPQPEEPKGVQDENYIQSRVLQWGRIFELDPNRQARYKEYEDMDTGLIAAQLDAITDSCFISDDGRQYGFKVIAGAKYQGVVDTVIERTGLDRDIRTYLRNLLKYGDLFVGEIIDFEQGNIVGLEAPPPAYMYKTADEHHRLSAEKNAFYQVDGTGNVIAQWYPWEMRHLRNDGIRQEAMPREVYCPGSFLEHLRRDWHKLRMIEEGMTIARIIRAYPRNFFKIDVTGKPPETAKAEIDALIKSIRTGKLSTDTVLEKPLEIAEDIFLGVDYRPQADGELKPSLTSVDHFDPQIRGLADITDIEYLRNKLFARVSGEVVGVESNRQDVSLQDIASSRMYQFYQRLLADDLIWPVLRLALLLKGYTPRRSDIDIIWPDVAVRSSWRFADAFFRTSLAYRTLVELGIAPRGFVAQEMLKVSKEEWEKWRDEEVPDEMAKLGRPNPGDVSGQQAAGNLSTGRDDILRTLETLAYWNQWLQRGG